MHTKKVRLFSRSSVVDKICASRLRMVRCLIVVFALVLSGVCRADIYSYTDKNSLTHFTDNLADIAEEQLTEIKVYQKTKSLVTPKEKPLPKAVTSEPSRSTTPVASPRLARQAKDPAALEVLKARKAALDMERAQLEKEQAELAEKGRKLRIGTAVRAHKRRMKELNDRFVVYQKKRDAFEKDWDAYHSSQ